jgi:N-acetylglucosaminyl-diphospho-decaprenol L-rhamnosyltransferase
VDLLVIILNYRTPDLTMACLRSLEAERVLAGRVVVVDNDSRDGSVPRLQSQVKEAGWEGWVHVLALPRNGGFAYGINAAIEWARRSPNPPEFVLLLNPDTVVLPGAVGALIEFMLATPEASIAGSRLEDMNGTGQRSAFRFHTIWSELEGALRVGVVSRLLARWVAAPAIPADPGQTDWVPGASMLVRSRVFDSVGLFDEGYFLYYEDMDFCRRAASAGFSCWYVPASRVAHHLGAATGMNWGTRVERVPAYWFKSRRRYFIKHHGRAYAALADLARLAGTLGRRLRHAIDRRADPDPPHFIEDFVRNSSFSGTGGA